MSASFRSAFPFLITFALLAPATLAAQEPPGPTEVDNGISYLMDDTVCDDPPAVDPANQWATTKHAACTASSKIPTAPIGDGFVAHFTLDHLEQTPLGPSLIVDDGNDLEATVAATDATGNPLDGLNLGLVLELDCGDAKTAFDALVDCHDQPGATVSDDSIVRAEGTNNGDGTYGFHIERADLDVLFANQDASYRPATLVHVFAVDNQGGGPGANRVSHYASSTQALVEAGAYDQADQVDTTNWQPVLLTAQGSDLNDGHALHINPVHGRYLPAGMDQASGVCKPDPITVLGDFCLDGDDYEMATLLAPEGTNAAGQATYDFWVYADELPHDGTTRDPRQKALFQDASHRIFLVYDYATAVPEFAMGGGTSFHDSVTPLWQCRSSECDAYLEGGRLKIPAAEVQPPNNGYVGLWSFIDVDDDTDGSATTTTDSASGHYSIPKNAAEGYAVSDAMDYMASPVLLGDPAGDGFTARVQVDGAQQEAGGLVLPVAPGDDVTVHATPYVRGIDGTYDTVEDGVYALRFYYLDDNGDTQRIPEQTNDPRFLDNAPDQGVFTFTFPASELPESSLGPGNGFTVQVIQLNGPSQSTSAWTNLFAPKEAVLAPGAAAASIADSMDTNHEGPNGEDLTPFTPLLTVPDAGPDGFVAAFYQDEAPVVQFHPDPDGTITIDAVVMEDVGDGYAAYNGPVQFRVVHEDGQGWWDGDDVIQVRNAMDGQASFTFKASDLSDSRTYQIKLKKYPAWPDEPTTFHYAGKSELMQVCLGDATATGCREAALAADLLDTRDPLLDSGFVPFTPVLAPSQVGDGFVTRITPIGEVETPLGTGMEADSGGLFYFRVEAFDALGNPYAFEDWRLEVHGVDADDSGGTPDTMLTSVGTYNGAEVDAPRNDGDNEVVVAVPAAVILPGGTNQRMAQVTFWTAYETTGKFSSYSEQVNGLLDAGDPRTADELDAALRSGILMMPYRGIPDTDVGPDDVCLMGGTAPDCTTEPAVEAVNTVLCTVDPMLGSDCPAPPTCEEGTFPVAGTCLPNLAPQSAPASGPTPTGEDGLAGLLDGGLQALWTAFLTDPVSFLSSLFHPLSLSQFLEAN